MLQPLHINPPHGVCLEQAVQMRKASVQYELDTLERLGIVIWHLHDMSLAKILSPAMRLSDMYLGARVATGKRLQSACSVRRHRVIGACLQQGDELAGPSLFHHLQCRMQYEC